MTALPVSPAQHRLRLVADLSAALVRPLAVFPAAVCAEAFPGTPLPNPDAGSPLFAPVNRAVARALDLGGALADPGFLARLDADAAVRLSALLASGREPPVREAALQVAAACLHKRAVGLVLKADRDRLRAVLGEDAMRVATDEAGLLHASLAVGGARWTDAAVLGDLADAEAARGRVVAFGMRVLARFVACAEPVLERLFALRLPPGPDAGSPIVLAGDHCDHVVKLIRRRLPQWAPIIA